jgi:hypothetical protein
VKEDDYQVPNANCTETTLTKTIEVKNIPASSIVTQYKNDDVIEAYVTSSDKGGNFYKSISFQALDGSRGFSVPVDVTSTFTNFEPGRKVFVSLKNQYTDISNDGVRIGTLYVSPSSGIASVGRLSAFDYGKVLHRSCTTISEELLVKKVTISEAKNDNLLNTLLEVNDVQLSECEKSKTYYDASFDVGGATNHLVTDANGNTLILRVGSFTNFAADTIPSGSGKIRGVMTKYGTDYQFIPRTKNDIQFNQTRFKTQLNETFDGGLNCWTGYSVKGDQVWTTDNQDGNYFAKMSGFSGSSNANEDWLISKKIDLSGYASASLSFETAKNFTGTALKLYISSDYTGYGSPSTAKWTLVTATFATANNYVWTPSGAIDLASYLGKNNVYFGFKYTSTTTNSATWELDNVKITATKN